jgi:hypothetical protein
MGGFSKGDSQASADDQTNQDAQETERSLETEGTRQATFDEVAEFQDSTEEYVDEIADQEQRKEEIEEKLEELGHEGSPYKQAHAEEGQERVEEQVDRDTEAGRMSVSGDVARILAGDSSPGDSGEQSPGEPVTEGMDPQHGGDEGFGRDARSHIDGEAAEERQVGTTDDGDVVVATANSVRSARGAQTQGTSHGEYAEGGGDTTGAGGEDTVYESQGYAYSTEESESTDSGVDGSQEADSWGRMPEYKKRGEQMETDNGVEMWRDEVSLGQTDPSEVDASTREVADGDGAASVIWREPLVLSGRHETQEIDRDSKTKAAQERIKGEHDALEESMENAVEIETTEARNREREVAAETEYQTRQDQIAFEKDLAHERLSPDADVSDPHEFHTSRTIESTDRMSESAKAKLERNGVETFEDLADLSPDEIDEMNISGIDREIAEQMSEQAAEFKTRREEAVAELDAELDGKFDEADYREAIAHGAYFGQSVDEMKERIKRNSGVIPGNDGPRADVEADRTAIRNLEPVNDGRGNHVQTESASVEGEVIDVVHESYLSDGVYQKFWIEDDNGDRTVVTVFKDSVEFEEDSITEDRDGAAGASDPPWANLGYGMNPEGSTVQRGDTVVVQNVVVDGNKVDGPKYDSDGYALSTTPSSDIKIEETRDGKSGAVVQADNQEQQDRIESRWTNGVPDPLKGSPTAHRSGADNGTTNIADLGLIAESTEYHSDEADEDRIARAIGGSVTPDLGRKVDTTSDSSSQGMRFWRTPLEGDDDGLPEVTTTD